MSEKETVKIYCTTKVERFCRYIPIITLLCNNVLLTDTIADFADKNASSEDKQECKKYLPLVIISTIFPDSHM